MFEFEGIDWFNLSSPRWFIRYPRLRMATAMTGRRLYLTWGLLTTWCLWTLFNRRCAGGGHFWGAGLLQIGRRHLLAFIKGQRLCVDVGFIHVYGRPE